MMRMMGGLFSAVHPGVDTKENGGFLPPPLPPLRGSLVVVRLLLELLAAVGDAVADLLSGTSHRVARGFGGMFGAVLHFVHSMAAAQSQPDHDTSDSNNVLHIFNESGQARS
jgi:hypothetical protein